MSRYKDADALMEKLKQHHDFFVEAWGGFKEMPLSDKARCDELTNCIAEIVNAPSIDIDLADDGTLSVEVDDATKVKRVLVEDGKNGDLYYADRPQGEWIKTDRLNCGARVYQCSICGEDVDEMPTVMSVPKYRFCPYCRAKMKGVDNE